MLEVAEADLDLEAGFVHVKGAQLCRRSLAELVDANDRRSGVSRWRGLASRAARVHRARRRRGTEGSNPAPSSAESGANLTFDFTDAGADSALDSDGSSQRAGKAAIRGTTES